MPEPPMFDGPWFYAIAGASICATSFFVTLWLTEPEQKFSGPPVPARIERLLTSKVYNRNSLDKEAQGAALFPSLGLQAVLDRVSRRQDGRAELDGWAANPANDGTPIVLVAFINGKGVMIGNTLGAREDVTRALRLPEAAARHVVVHHALDCPAVQQFMLVAIDQKGGYFALDPRYCP
jgi:hypothetical protein